MSEKRLEELLRRGDDFTRDELIVLLQAEGEAMEKLLAAAAAVKRRHVGDKVYFRGLIEYSNRCTKNCLYCGVRSGNAAVSRYQMTEAEVLEAVDFAWRNGYASIVLQAGERCDREFVREIRDVLLKIHAATHQELRVTLSLGEQTSATYRLWHEAGARRYLLRIETASRELYSRLHPDDGHHRFDDRIAALRRLRDAGYQVGTGVMVGLPGQDVGHLADDLRFFRDMDIDMFGLGPYLEHEDTPLWDVRNTLWPKTMRLDYALKMVAILRLWLKDVNIAATTAMQAVDPQGRERAIRAGANVIMPNLTPTKYRGSYLLYEGKPCLDEDKGMCRQCLFNRIATTGNQVALGEWGDSVHFTARVDDGTPQER
jgi:biotin synthase